MCSQSHTKYVEHGYFSSKYSGFNRHNQSHDKTKMVGSIFVAKVLQPSQCTLPCKNKMAHVEFYKCLLIIQELNAPMNIKIHH